MVDQSPDPPFKGTFTSESADFLKHFKETVIKNKERLVFITSIFNTHGHHGMEITLIQLLLTPAVISDTSLYKLMF